MSEKVAISVKNSHHSPEELDTQEKFIRYCQENPLKVGIATNISYDLLKRAWPIFRKMVFKR